MIKKVNVSIVVLISLQICCLHAMRGEFLGYTRTRVESQWTLPEELQSLCEKAYRDRLAHECTESGTQTDVVEERGAASQALPIEKKRLRKPEAESVDEKYSKLSKAIREKFESEIFLKKDFMKKYQILPSVLGDQHAIASTGKSRSELLRLIKELVQASSEYPALMTVVKSYYATSERMAEESEQSPSLEQSAHGIPQGAEGWSDEEEKEVPMMPPAPRLRPQYIEKEQFPDGFDSRVLDGTRR
jgi:hypothetical protein